jgi:hypothetical protein
MKNLVIEQTKSSPSIRFDAEAGTLDIRGKSYPEDASKFYSPVFDWVTEYFTNHAHTTTVVNLEIIYLNSSSSKALLVLLDMLDTQAKQGNDVIVNWRYHEGNEMAIECGEEFGDELEAVTYNMAALP